MKTLQPLLVALTAVVVARTSHGDAPARHKFDVRDIVRLSAPARERFERGETLLEAGDAGSALPLFQEVTTDAPDNAIAFRRVCDALTALGRRDEAIAACTAALTRRGSAMDFRSYVGALTSGSELMTPEDMSQAVTFARRARELMPDQPWGYAAKCDIARRLGDTEMLNDCIQHLKRVAPEHRETTRALALASPSGGYRVVAGWALLALACVGTMVHALLRARTRRLSRASAVALGCWLAGVTPILPTPAHGANTAPAASPANPAEEPTDLGKPPVPGSFSRWTIDENDPLKSIPPPETLHKDPLQFGYFMMDLSERADQATQRGDHAAAVKFWQALAKVTPDRSHAFSKMCVSYEALGMLDNAVYSCGAALERAGTTLKDYMRFVGLTLSKKGDLTSGEIATLDKVLDHLKTDEAGKGIVDELACRIGVWVRSATRLEPCTAALAAHAPNHPDTVYFQWALAVARGRASEARALIGRSHEVSMKPEDIQRMEMETQKLEAKWKNHLGIALGLLLAFGSGVGLYASRRRASRALKDAAPSGATA